jgi:ribosomal protein L40E
MTHEVFICHSSNDAAIANTVCATLESNHIPCWIAPRDVLPGAIWGEAVANAIDGSRIVVLIISTYSCKSSQVLREVERAASKNTPILPLRIDNVSISGAIEFFVSSRHWLDAQTPPLKKHLQKLADTVKRLLEQEQLTQNRYNIPQAKSAVFTKEGPEAVKAAQQVIICPKCGTKLRPGAGFCSKCGARVSEGVRDEAEDKLKKEAEEARKVQEAREKAAREAEEARKAQEAQEKAAREAEEARKAQEAQEKSAREAEEAKKAQEAREKEERDAEEARKVQEAQEKAASEAETIKPSPQVSLCPKCGNELRPGAGFCNKCGTHINQSKRAEAKENIEKESAKSSQQSLYCPKCGHSLRPSAGFCDKCGARISRGEKDK